MYVRQTTTNRKRLTSDITSLFCNVIIRSKQTILFFRRTVRSTISNAMNTSKKINVNFSSLVGLKAELLRKQTEIKDAKAKEDGQPRVPKPKVKSKKPREPKIEPKYTEIEDVATLKKSRIMLEAKSMLYDKLKKSGGDETRNYLVDFGQKSDDSDDEFYKEDDYEDANSDPEDDWVEYQDCFGRTRKCLRRDLPKMREKDNLVKRDIMKEPETENRREKSPEPPVIMPEKEPEIEIMRKKWEEQMERLAEKTDIHYQDVLFDEARTHGVGYYGFSQNEEERARQQESLAKLRKETELRQREMQETRDMKSRMELNRLRAATIRRRVRAGLPAELTEDEEETLRAQIKLRNSSDVQDAEKDASPEEIEAASKAVSAPETRVDNSLVVIEDKIKAFGELLGKRSKFYEMSQEEWLYKRRKDRLGEFAPVYENFRRSGCLKENRDSRMMPREGDEEDPVRINAAGPEPTDVWESAEPPCQDEPEDSSTRKEDLATVEDSEDSDDADLIGPPRPPELKNSMPPTFINSFVPQPIVTVPTLPVSFDSSVPPPPIVNLSRPPPSIIPPIAATTASRNDRVIEDSESSDSDDSLIIGPVPPPSISQFSNVPAQSCGPSLIDNEHINMLSEIPLPTTVQFPSLVTYPTTSLPLPEIQVIGEEARSSTDSPTNPSSNLDVSSITAGLKFLRQKFETKPDTER